MIFYYYNRPISSSSCRIVGNIYFKEAQTWVGEPVLFFTGSRLLGVIFRSFYRLRIQLWIRLPNTDANKRYQIYSLHLIPLCKLNRFNSRKKAFMLDFCLGIKINKHLIDLSNTFHMKVIIIFINGVNWFDHLMKGQLNVNCISWKLYFL